MPYIYNTLNILSTYKAWGALSKFLGIGVYTLLTSFISFYTLKMAV